MSTEEAVTEAADMMPFIYTILATQVLLPLGVRVNKWITDKKDSVPDTLKDINASLTEIKTGIALNSKSGALDDDSVTHVYRTALKLLMLRLMSLYTERTRLNHIASERHRVVRRYEIAAEVLSTKLYSELEIFTCNANGRKLSGFLNNSGGELLVKAICDELFQVQEAIHMKNDDMSVNVEDIEASLERYIDTILTRVKRWVADDTESLDKNWVKISEDITFFRHSI